MKRPVLLDEIDQRLAGDGDHDASRLRAARLAHDEVGRKDDLPGAVEPAAFDPLEEQLRPERPERLRRLQHHGQERVEPRRVLDVVVADEGNVVGHLEACRAHGLDRSERDEVVDGEDAGGPLV